jgi:PilZ domain
MTLSTPKPLRSFSKDGRDFQRRFPRFRTDFPLIVRVLGQDGYLRVHGRCTEIAERGLGAVTSAELVTGEIVSLELPIPANQRMELRAVVRHRMGFLHGFEFISLQPGQGDLIREFCDQLIEDR